MRSLKRSPSGRQAKTADHRISTAQRQIITLSRLSSELSVDTKWSDRLVPPRAPNAGSGLLSTQQASFITQGSVLRSPTYPRRRFWRRCVNLCNRVYIGKVRLACCGATSKGLMELRNLATGGAVSSHISTDRTISLRSPYTTNAFDHDRT